MDDRVGFARPVADEVGRRGGGRAARAAARVQARRFVRLLGRHRHRQRLRRNHRSGRGDQHELQILAQTLQQGQVAKLMRSVRSTAEKIAVSPELLATRRDVEQLVYFNKPDALITGWRKQMIGDELLAEFRS